MTTAPPAARTTVSFRATILLGGKTATGIRVPDEVVQALGSSKRPRVHVTINDYAYRSTVAPMRGSFMLPVSAAVGDGAHVQGGDERGLTARAVLSVEGAKTGQTRQRRITKAVATLREERA